MRVHDTGTTGPRCRECNTRGVAQGTGESSIQAKELGLCTTCLGTPGVSVKWKNELGIPLVRRKPSELGGAEPCRECKTHNVAGGKTPRAVAARELGLCQNCQQKRGVAQKWKKELGLPTRYKRAPGTPRAPKPSNVPKCRECGEPGTTGVSERAKDARKLGICFNCVKTTGVASKWRKELGLSAKNPSVTGKTPCKVCGVRTVAAGKCKSALRAAKLGLCQHCAGLPDASGKKRKGPAGEMGAVVENCVECSGPGTLGGGKAAQKARALGLCLRCFKRVDIRAKRRRELGEFDPIEPASTRLDYSGLCRECRKHSISKGAGAEAKRAQLLGLCVTCNNIAEVREKWRESLDLGERAVLRAAPDGLAAAIADLGEVLTGELKKAVGALLGDVKVLGERTFAWIDSLRRYRTEVNEMMRKAEKQARESAAEVRREFKRLGLVRSAVDRESTAMPKSAREMVAERLEAEKVPAEEPSTDQIEREDFVLKLHGEGRSDVVIAGLLEIPVQEVKALKASAKKRG